MGRTGLVVSAESPSAASGAEPETAAGTSWGIELSEKSDANGFGEASAREEGAREESVADMPREGPEAEAGATSVVADGIVALVRVSAALTDREPDDSASVEVSGAEAAPGGAGAAAGGGVKSGATESSTEGATGAVRLATRLSG